MYFTKSVAVAILAFAPSVVFGQSGQSTGQSTGQSNGQSSGSSNGQNIVQLGAGGNLMFTPNMMTVNQGDNVTFAFMSAAHAVMSTSLSQPNVADDQVYSGIIPVDNTTPTPTGKKLPKGKKLRVRGEGPMGYVLPRAKKAKKAKGQTTAQNSGVAGTATFTVQMNNVGMQAFVCPAAQHAANGMIMMINVLPAGTGSNNQKRQNSDAQLQRALTNYLAVGQKTKTVQPSVNAGTGGTLNAAAAAIAQ